MRSVIDVMVLYTGAAREAYGEQGVHEKIALGFAYLNEACNRSGVNARFRPVHSEEVTWHTETALAADELHWLARDNTVADLRDEVGADLVSLFVRDGLPTGGMAHLPGAFSVFNGSPFLFAHECGHNLGCNHNRAHAFYHAGGSGCNYGYVFTPLGSPISYGDIMSYDGCQFQQFSNPAKFFQGAPTGIPEGHIDAAGFVDAADNALTLNRSAAYAGWARLPQSSFLEAAQVSEDGTGLTVRISGAETGLCTIEESVDNRTWSMLTNCWLNGEGAEVTAAWEAGYGQKYYRARLGKVWLAGRAGLVKRDLPPGFSMIANPLDAPDNTVGGLFPDVPDGTQIYKWIEGLQAWTCNTFSYGEWDDPAMTLHPGEGVVFNNRSGARLSVLFTGEVLQACHNRIPTQLSVRSSPIPEPGALSSVLKYVPFGAGGQVFRMSRGRYTAYTWDGKSWSPEEPVIEVGEAFWCRNPVNPLTWQRTLDRPDR